MVRIKRGERGHPREIALEDIDDIHICVERERSMLTGLKQI